MVLKETGWGGMDWIHQARDKDHQKTLMNVAINFRVP
jgi:hypothetical protein